jgi:hypothetical protein
MIPLQLHRSKDTVAVQITVKKSPDSAEESLDIPNAAVFVAQYPFALARTADGQWVSFEKLYPVTGFEA